MMKITTQYKTSANSGRSQILAKGFGRQKTTTFDPSKSSAWNHGTAAAALIQAVDEKDSPTAGYKAETVVILLDKDSISHDSNDSGTVHTFTA